MITITMDGGKATVKGDKPAPPPKPVKKLRK